MAVDFVLSKLNRSVGTRAESNQAPVRHEIPPDVVREAVVNAIAHRDYTTAGAVQVSVFADRVEVWNPGALLPPLTLESLRQPHGSIARNPRICEALFLGHYIEKYGTGTLMMIRESLAHALPEPDFAQRGGEFTITIWRDWLTDAVMDELGLNERQRKAIAFVKTNGRITNKEYQGDLAVSKPTASRDLELLRRIKVFTKVGSTGKGTYYVLSRKGLIGLSKSKGLTKGSMGSSVCEVAAHRMRQKCAKRATGERGRRGNQPRHKPDKPDMKGPQRGQWGHLGDTRDARNEHG